MAPAWKSEFLQFCIDSDVLCFGDFTLKSGRSSPYFFNAGLFNTGRRICQLGKYYAAAITEAGIEYDVLFGPAYKGIPLATTAVVALADLHGQDVPFSFNRKEAKDHGEGGTIVGAPLVGRILVIDDVITAGTAARESASMIHAAGAQLAGLVIALDRQEKGTGTELSAVQQLEQTLQVPVVPIATLTDMIEFLETSQPDQAARLRAHKLAHGVA